MKLLSIGNESIGFQHDAAYYKELIIIIKDHRAAKDFSPEALNKLAVRLDVCTSKHTGITTNTMFLNNTGSDAFIALPGLTRGNVLNRGSFNKFLAKNFSADNISFYQLEKKGWINPAESTVGGAFSEIIFKLYMGKGWLTASNGPTIRSPDDEIASIILHEVGHAYTFLQFMADTVIVNSVLQRTYQEIANGNVDGKVKIILTKAADDMRLKDREWLEAIEPNTDAISALRLLVTAVEIEPRMMDNKRFFAKDQAEELADIFVVRHGGGAALLSARSKLAYQSQSYPYLRNIAWALLGLATAPVLPWIGIPLCLINTIRLIGTAGRNVVNSAFVKDLPTFKQEATKIRNQFVEQLKTSDVPKDQIAEIIESIALTDRLIQNYTGDFDPSLLSKFVDIFRRSKLDLRASREYTGKLEDLAANNLFIASAKFSARSPEGDHEYR